MISFENDYIQGAHPEVLKRLAETTYEPLSGYGTAPYCESAREKIRRECGCPDAEIHFLVGGTQTNAVVIDAMLKGYEGVVAAVTGPVAVGEGGGGARGRRGPGVPEPEPSDGSRVSEERTARDNVHGVLLLRLHGGLLDLPGLLLFRGSLVGVQELPDEVPPVQA